MEKKCMVMPDQYLNYKYGGETVRNTEEELKSILQFFPEYCTREDLLNAMTHRNLDNMFTVVKRAFYKEYGYEAENVELSNKFQHTINSYIYNDLNHPAFVHIDELFESTIMSFLLVMFKWSKNFDDIELYSRCFKQILYLLNDVCIFGQMQEEIANKTFLKVLDGDIQILQLAEDCYWTIVVFSLAHEIAHSYFSHIGKYYDKDNLKQEEYDADRIAYHIVLKIIEQEDNVLEKYSYLAPMIYMDFFDLYYFTDKTLYGIDYQSYDHPEPKDRRISLLDSLEKEDFSFDTEEGNILYNAFLDVYETFKEQMLIKREKGKLDPIIHTEKRNQLRSGMLND